MFGYSNYFSFARKERFVLAHDSREKQSIVGRGGKSGNGSRSRELVDHSFVHVQEAESTHRK